MNDLVSFTREVLAIPSLTGDEGAAITRCTEEMRRIGFDVEIDDLGSLLGIAGHGSPRILFDAHIDTVAPNSGWSINPFGAIVKNGRLYGLGAVDMKGPACALIHGVGRALRKNRLDGTIGVSITTLEETSEGATLGPLVKRFQPDAVVISEPSTLRLMTAQKGRAEIKIVVEGRGAHAAFPDKGVNALSAAAAVLAALREKPQPSDPELGIGYLVPTEAITEPFPGISIVPTRCSLRLDRRLLPLETAESVISELRSALNQAEALGAKATAALSEGEIITYTGQVINARRFLPAWRTELSTPLVRAAHHALEQALGSVSVSAYRFCTNGSLTAGELGVPTIGFGPGVTELAHQADEHILLEDLERGAVGFAALTEMRLNDTVSLILN